tara:strand:- start:2662 stop:3159 length:498 start_codon:yes stop_codon:yes gene_type:complete
MGYTPFKMKGPSLYRSPNKKTGYGVSGKEGFDEMFSKAKKHGEKEFTWKGKKYHTVTKDEIKKSTKDAQTTGDYKDIKNKLIKGGSPAKDKDKDKAYQTTPQGNPSKEMIEKIKEDRVRQRQKKDIQNIVKTNLGDIGKMARKSAKDMLDNETFGDRMKRSIGLD